MLGRNGKGQVRILCYQFGGDSASGLQDGSGAWRCLTLEKFSAVAFLDGAWHTTGGAVRQPKCIERIELSVDDQHPREPQ
jgi:hypothetical protein